MSFWFFFFQAEDGIRDFCLSRGLGDVYKRQGWHVPTDGEWMTIEMALGMSEAEANNTGYRGTDLSLIHI